MFIFNAFVGLSLSFSFSPGRRKSIPTPRDCLVMTFRNTLCMCACMRTLGEGLKLFALDVHTHASYYIYILHNTRTLRRYALYPQGIKSNVYSTLISWPITHVNCLFFHKPSFFFRALLRTRTSINVHIFSYVSDPTWSTPLSSNTVGIKPVYIL